MKTINLNWQPIQILNKIDFGNSINKSKKSNDYRGVYIWGFNFDGDFIPYYVGKSDNIFSRIFEHLGSLLGGSYTIYHKKSLKNFCNFKDSFKTWDNYIPDEGIVYYPRDLKSMKWFHQNREKLNEHINLMYDSFAFIYAKFNDKDNIKLRDVEVALINKIGKNKLGNSYGGNSKIEDINLPNIKNFQICKVIEKTKTEMI